MINEVVPKVFPVFLLILLGIVIRKKSILTESSIEDIKKIIINLVLPCVLYFSFVNLELKPSLIVLIAGMFLMCFLLLLLGIVLKPLKLADSEYYPFLFTGFEFGMMGASFFGAVFGVDKVGYIGMVGLGHEFFIWFVFVTLLVSTRDGKSNIGATARSFIKSPVIIAILLGVFLNLTGIRDSIGDNLLVKPLYSAMHFIEQLVVPLILIVIGYGLEFKYIRIKSGLAVVIIRFCILIPAALIINRWIIREFLGLDALYEAAVFIFFILPPPFIIPIFMDKGSPKEQAEINGVLVLYSLFSIIAFTGYYVFYSLSH